MAMARARKPETRSWARSQPGPEASQRNDDCTLKTADSGHFTQGDGHHLLIESSPEDKGQTQGVQEQRQEGPIERWPPDLRRPREA